jgi:hypothetical protein
MTKRFLMIGILSATALVGACKKKGADAAGGSGSDESAAAMAAAAAGSAAMAAGSAAAAAGSAAAAAGSAAAAAGSAMAMAAAAAGSGSGSAAAGSAAPAAGALASTDDYKKLADSLNAKMTDIAKETDCKKLGAAMSTAIDANKADIDAVTAWEKAHPDDKKAYDTAKKDQMQKDMANVVKCKDDPAVSAAMAKMPAE